MLTGPWQRAGMIERIKLALGPRARRQRWYHRYADRVIEAFPSRPPPAQRQLTRFIQSDGVYRRICTNPELSEEVAWPNDVSTLPLPAPVVQPALGAAESWDVPAITTPGALADWLEITPSELDWLADTRGLERYARFEQLRNYHYQWIGKRSRGRRLIEAPKRRLKAAQRRVLAGILSLFPAHDAAHGFRVGRSPVSFAKPHVGRDVVMRIDLRNFFPSVPARRVFGIFHTAGYPEPVARALTGFCTNTVPQFVIDGAGSSEYDGRRRLDEQYRMTHLPQGAPSSPALANLCAWRLDRRLSGLAKCFGASYTRHADDLAFSGSFEFRRNLSRFRVFACAIAINEGFDVRNRKTRVMPVSQRQQVAGVVVNQRCGPGRCEYDKVKATLTNCIRHGPGSQNRNGHADFRSHLRGRIAWVAMLNERRGNRLKQLFDRIAW